MLDILIANHFQLNSKASGVELEKKILSLSDYFLNMLRHTVYRHSAKNKPKWIFSNAIALGNALTLTAKEGIFHPKGILDLGFKSRPSN